jgi:hypothetical protein
MASIRQASSLEALLLHIGQPQNQQLCSAPTLHQPSAMLIPHATHVNAFRHAASQPEVQNLRLESENAALPGSRLSHNVRPAVHHLRSADKAKAFKCGIGSALLDPLEGWLAGTHLPVPACWPCCLDSRPALLAAV